MSTKATIAYGDNFHFYHEVLDEDHVYLELETTHFEAGYGRVMLPIPVHIWETIRQLGGVRLDLVDHTDEDLLAMVTADVDTRLAQYQEALRNHPDRAGLMSLAGALLYGTAEEPRAAQKLNQAHAELSPYASLAEHRQKVHERLPTEGGAELEGEHEPSLVSVPDNLRLHDLLHLVCIQRPTDFTPYGLRQREAADCSCGCKHYVALEGDLGADWGVCANLRSPRAGLLTFEHQGCEFFAYDERSDAEIEPRGQKR